MLKNIFQILEERYYRYSQFDLQNQESNNSINENGVDFALVFRSSCRECKTQLLVVNN